MSLQICPRCKSQSFLWTCDDEHRPQTQWYCSICDYLAFEDESLERVCSLCNNKTESKLQEEDGAEYWWYFKCNAIK